MIPPLMPSGLDRCGYCTAPALMHSALEARLCAEALRRVAKPRVCTARRGLYTGRGDI